MKGPWREKLVQLYAEVDAAVQAAGPRCEQSGRCCRFTEWGHVLFLSLWEAEYLLEGAPDYQQPVGPDGCPFQVNRLCTARATRPLGCRIYFCDPSYQETAHRIMEQALSRLKQWVAEEGMPWRYAPLHVFLNEAYTERRTRPAPSRIALPIRDTLVDGHLGREGAAAGRAPHDGEGK
jgi:Fe-S-cluster containining protein